MIQIKDIIILQEATQDLEQGRDFYRQQEWHIGDYFWDSLISDIESLYIYAGVHIEEEGFMRLLSKRFPYAIYYLLIDQIVQVTAVLPVRRKPSWIKQTLCDR